MKVKYLTSILLFTVNFISCNSDESDGTLKSLRKSDAPLLTRLVFNKELYNEYSYTIAGLIEIDRSKYHYIKYNYGRNDQVISAEMYWDENIFSSSSSAAESALNRAEWVSPENTPKTSFSTYEYNDLGQLTDLKIYRWHSDVRHSTFIYDTEGRIQSQSFYDGGGLSGFDTYEYDDRGNVRVVEKYYVSEEGDTTLSVTYEYEYDDKINPYQSFRSLSIPGIYTNTNNIIKEMVIFENDDTIDSPQITETTYDYNFAGYPVRKDGLVKYVYE